MRVNVERALNTGASLGVFAGNTMYWQIRYEGPGDRVVVCYRKAVEDPLYGKQNSLVTVHWREPPLSEPESLLLGESYGSWNTRPPAALVVKAKKSSWFTGTGLRAGTSVPGIVGPEYDRVDPAYPRPPGLHILTASPLVNSVGGSDTANSTMYTTTTAAIISSSRRTTTRNSSYAASW